jgi:hypothetical protein
MAGLLVLMDFSAQKPAVSMRTGIPVHKEIYMITEDSAGWGPIPASQ